MVISYMNEYGRQPLWVVTFGLVNIRRVGCMVADQTMF